MKSLYDFPDIYDAVLRKPLDVIEKEAGRLSSWLGTRGIDPGAGEVRILELACGTCAHSLALKRRGFQVAGLDRSPAMLTAAGQQAGAAGLPLELFSGDIVNFRLDAPPYDAVIFTSETFPVITRFEDLTTHFRSVRRALRPGGLYLIDLDARRHGVGASSGEWDGERSPCRMGW
jgi:SAM-dependent methyltransferase